jgi:hypothetical protein
MGYPDEGQQRKVCDGKTEIKVCDGKSDINGYDESRYDKL